MLTQLVAQSFGLLIGATVMVPKTAQTITAVTMLGMMLVRPSILGEICFTYDYQPASKAG